MNEGKNKITSEIFWESFQTKNPELKKCLADLDAYLQVVDFDQVSEIDKERFVELKTSISQFIADKEIQHDREEFVDTWTKEFEELQQKYGTPKVAATSAGN